MTQRLYTVTITYTALVLAGDEFAAADKRYEIVRCEDYPKVTATLFDGALPDGWDATCLVYTTEHEDLFVPEAIAIHEGKA